MAIGLSRWIAGKEPGMFYDPELWPEVSNLVIFEMAKRAWSVFKIYFTNLSLELGDRPYFLDIDVGRPKPVEDIVSHCTVHGSANCI